MLNVIETEHYGLLFISSLSSILFAFFLLELPTQISQKKIISQSLISNRERKFPFFAIYNKSIWLRFGLGQSWVELVRYVEAPKNISILKDNQKGSIYFFVWIECQMCGSLLAEWLFEMRSWRGEEKRSSRELKF